MRMTTLQIIAASIAILVAAVAALRSELPVVWLVSGMAMAMGGSVICSQLVIRDMDRDA